MLRRSAGKKKAEREEAAQDIIRNKLLVVN
jgi:hypothetical protein